MGDQIGSLVSTMGSRKCLFFWSRNRNKWISFSTWTMSENVTLKKTHICSPCLMGNSWNIFWRRRNTRLRIFKDEAVPWRGTSVGYSVILICEGCGFDAQSGHVQEPTKTCINKGNSKLMFLSLTLSAFFPLSKTKYFLERDCRRKARVFTDINTIFNACSFYTFGTRISPFFFL